MLVRKIFQELFCIFEILGSINAYCGERRDADIYHETILKPAELFEAFDGFEWCGRERNYLGEGRGAVGIDANM